jgi:acyl dehydratase
VRYLVSKAEIIQFAKQFNPGPFHTDEEAAIRSVFGWLTAHAKLVVNCVHVVRADISQAPTLAFRASAEMLCPIRVLPVLTHS